MNITKRRFSVGNNDPEAIKEFMNKIKKQSSLETTDMLPADRGMLTILQFIERLLKCPK